MRILGLATVVAESTNAVEQAHEHRTVVALSAVVVCGHRFGKGCKESACWGEDTEAAHGVDNKRAHMMEYSYYT